MKKSTLITTIAMIVVVVVALSTATYAWFTSQTETYATQTITVESASDISVAVNNAVMLATSTPAVFTATTSLLAKTQGTGANDYGLRQGLWAPQGTLSNGPSSNASLEVTSSAVTKFVSGTQSTDGNTFTVVTAPVNQSADMIRVTNYKASAETINLTIYVGAKDTDAARFAAQGVSFYIAGYNGSTQTVIANTQYGYMPASMTKTTDYDDNDSSDSLTASDTFAMSKFTNAPSTGTITYNAAWEAAFEADSSIPAINHRSTDVTVGTNFETAAQNDGADKAGIAYGTYTKWYSMTVSLSSFNSSQSKNFLIYTWLDGAYVTNAASSAEIAIAYSFDFAS